MKKSSYPRVPGWPAVIQYVISEAWAEKLDPPKGNDVGVKN
jgi:hypothetical protein